MDKLDAIFKMQKELNDYIIEKRPENKKFTQNEWIQKHMIALISELGEVLGEINFKWWKSEKEIDYNSLKEELIDVLHFYISMCLAAGMTSDEMYDIYMQKNSENIKRQDGTSLQKDYHD